MIEEDNIEYFNVEDAVLYGVKEAVVLRIIRTWVFHSLLDGEDFIDGFYWAEIKIDTLCHAMPYISRKSMGNIINSLESQGVIKTIRVKRDNGGCPKLCRILKK